MKICLLGYLAALYFIYGIHWGGLRKHVTEMQTEMPTALAALARLRKLLSDVPENLDALPKKNMPKKWNKISFNNVSLMLNASK